MAVPAIWGGTFIAGRKVAKALPASIGALLRDVIASIALLAASRLLEGRLPRHDRRQIAGTQLQGATGIFS
jgi:hypothetical protein